MAFNAGAIEATFTLDRTPFQAGVRQARREVEQLSRLRPEIRLQVSGAQQAQATLQRLLADAQRFNRLWTARFEVQGGNAEREMERLARQADRLAGIRRIRFEAETSQFNQEAERVERRMQQLNRQSVNPSVNVNTSRAMNGLGGLLAGILSIAPAVIPMAAAVTGGMVTVTAAFATAGAAAGVMGLAVSNQLKVITKAMSDLEKAKKKYDTATTKAGKDAALAEQKKILAALNADQIKAMQSFEQLKAAFKGFGQTAQQPILQGLISGANALSLLLKRLEPAVAPLATIFRNMTSDFERMVGGPAMGRFISWFTIQGPAALQALINAGKDTAKAIGNIFKAFGNTGAQTDFLNWIQQVANRFLLWTQGDGLTRFVAYVNRWLPVTIEFFKQLSLTVGRLIQTFAPIGGIILTALVPMAKALAWIAEEAPWVIQAMYGLMVATRLYAGAVLLSTLAMKAWGIALKVASVATRIFSGVMWLLNAAVAANPIGLFVLLLVGLGAALVLAYKKSETFRNIVNAAFRLTGQVALWLWNKAIKPVFDQTVKILTGVINFIKTHWKTGLKILLVAVTGPLGLVIIYITKHWDKFKGIFQAGLNAVKKVLSVALDFMVGYWKFQFAIMRKILSTAWAAIRLTFTTIRNSITGTWRAITSTASRLWRDGWNNLRAIFNGAWTRLRDSMTAMKNKMGEIWNGIVSTATRIFDGIRKAVGKPINIVIGFVVDKLIPLANKALGLVGAPQIPTKGLAGFKIPGYAGGGVVSDPGGAAGILPGYSPGRDNMIAQSPYGAIGLAGGEGILRPEVMKVPEARSFLHAANYAARSGGVGRVQSMLGFADGGIFDGQPAWDNPIRPQRRRTPLIPGFADGGIFDKIKNVAQIAVPPLGLAKLGKAGLQSRGFQAIYSKTVGPWVDRTLKALKEQGAFGGLAASTAKKIIDSIVGFTDGKTLPVGDAGTWGDASERLRRALQWAKTQDGKPYQWGGGGNPSWDCSGFMAGIENVLRGIRPGRRYTTFDFEGSRAPSGWERGLESPFTVGVTNRGVGHMAGNLLGVPVESAGGGKGVNVGAGARGAFDSMFGNNQYGFRPVLGEAKKVSAGGPGAGGRGWAPAYFTHFWDAATATGKMTSDTIASSYIPLGSRLQIGWGSNSTTGTVRDLGPAQFVYDRHPGMAVLDLATPLMRHLTGGTGNVQGGFRITSVGSGRTLYGRRLRGYDSGGDLAPGYTVAWNGTGETESVVTSKWRKRQELVNDLLLQALANGAMGSKSVNQTNHLYEVGDGDAAARKILSRTVEGLS